MFDDIIGNVSKKVILNVGSILLPGFLVIYDQKLDKTLPIPTVTIGADTISKIIADHQDPMLAEWWIELLNCHDTIIHYRVRAYFIGSTRHNYPFYKCVI